MVGQTFKNVFRNCSSGWTSGSALSEIKPVIFVLAVTMCAAGLGQASSVSADTLELNSGQLIEGTIVSENDQLIKIDQGVGIPITYYKDQIRKVFKAAPVNNKPPKLNIPQKIISRLHVAKRFYFKSRSIMAAFQLKYPLPRNDIAYQKILNIQISPSDYHVNESSGGQKIAEFKFSHLAIDQEISVVIQYEVEINSVEQEILPDKMSELTLEQQRSLGEYLVLDRGGSFKQPGFVKIFDLIVADAKDPWHRAKAIYDYLIKSMRYEDRADLKMTHTPEEIFNRGKGNCVDLAVLYVQLARLSGIPARVVNGLVFQAPDERVTTLISQTGHTWAEIFFSGYGWVPVDPTFGIKYPQKYFAFAYQHHIREFYGLSENQNSNLVYRGEIEVSPFPGLALPEKPLESSQDLKIELISSTP